MKILVIVILLFVSHIATSQVVSTSTRFNFSRSTKLYANQFELNLLPMFEGIDIHKEFNAITVDPDGTMQKITRSKVDDGLLFGLRAELGYRINERWSAGLQGGAGMGMVELRPEGTFFHSSAYFGGYGTFHFNDHLSLMFGINSRTFTGRRKGVSFGLSPQVMLKENLGLMLGVEYHTGSHSRVYYSVQETELQDGTIYPHQHSGFGIESSQGFIYQVGLRYKIGR